MLIIDLKPNNHLATLIYTDISTCQVSKTHGISLTISLKYLAENHQKQSLKSIESQ
jgi:hypothetical protein